MENGSRGRFDESKEDVLVKWKVELDGENVVGCRLISHDNARPRLDVKRWYLGKDRKWYPAKKAERLPYDVIVSIVKHVGEIEKAMEEWTKKHGAGRPGAPNQGPAGW